MQQGCGADHPPPASAKVKDGVELYIYSPSGWTLSMFHELFLDLVSHLFFIKILDTCQIHSTIINDLTNKSEISLGNIDSYSKKPKY